MSRSTWLDGFAKRVGASASGGTDPAPLEVQVHRGADAVERARSAWAALLGSRSRSAFHHQVDWYAGYAASLAATPENLRVLVARTAGAPSAIVPLCAIHSRVAGVSLRVLEAPRHSHLPFADVILGGDAEPASLDALFAALRQLREEPWDLLRFERADADSALVRWARETGAPLVLSVLRGRADHIELPGTYAELAATFTRNQRGVLRKARNRLAGLPGVNVQVTRERSALVAAFAEFLQVESSGWKGAAGAVTAIALQPGLVDFYRGLLNGLGPLGACEIAVLRAADGPIAASFSLVLDGTCFVLKIGYDEAFSPVAPGTVLIDELLQHAYAAGIHRVDLISDAEWHSRWHTASRGVYEVVVANYTPAGVLAFQMLRARELARPWVRRMRTALRRTDLCPPA